MNRAFTGQYHANVPLSLSKNYHIVAPKGEMTFRAYLPVEVYGSFDWIVWDRNFVDSTWEYGDYSTANQKGGRYRIVAASVGVSDDDNRISQLTQLTFGGEKSIWVDDEYCSDPFSLTVEPGQKLVYSQTIALESETLLPTTPDSIALAYCCDGNQAFAPDSTKMRPAEQLLLPSLFACSREVSYDLTVWGDSITQGCGTEVNRAQMWAAQLAKQLAPDVAVWNIGLGFGHGEDAATCGAWLEKANLYGGCLQICFGVNDILTGGRNAAQILADYRTLIEAVRRANPQREIVLCTIPAFDLEGEQLAVWEQVNRVLRTELAQVGDVRLFDFAAVVGTEGEPRIAKYGPHPDAAGCLAIASAMAAGYTSR